MSNEFIPEEVKEYINRALSIATGDELERAKRAYSNKTPQQMQKEHGQSGKTCQEILNSYQKERDLNTAAKELVKNL